MCMTPAAIRETQQKRNAALRKQVKSGDVAGARKVAAKRLRSAGIIDSKGKLTDHYR